MTLSLRFLAHLKDNGPSTAVAAALALNESHVKVGKTANNLVAQGCVSYIGVWRANVYTFIKFPMKAGGRPSRRRRTRTAASSGVLAPRVEIGRGFRWLEME